MDNDRRRVLLGLASLPLAACSSTETTTAPSPSASASASLSPSSTTASAAPMDTPLPSSTPTTSPPPPPPAPALPTVSAWQPGPGEPLPQLKQAAAAFIEAAGTWAGGAGAARSLTALGVPPQIAATAIELEAPGAVSSNVQVIYPQFGGVQPADAAIILLFDQEVTAADGVVTRRQKALDLRLALSADQRWTVLRINPLTSLGSPIARSQEANAVLAQPRIELSAPARIDVTNGRMDRRLLRVLLGLANDHVLAVDVMATGHIQTVYPTPRLSNHAVGRAVDLRAVDGMAVVDKATPVALLTRVMLGAAKLGATEVGGPFDLNGPKRGFFSDTTHQDHLHIGISENTPPASL